MGNGFLISQVRRINRNFFIVYLIVILSVMAVFSIKWNYLYNVFSGPYKADSQWLTSITDPASEKRNYIELKSPIVHNMWFHEVLEEYSEYSGKVQKTTVKADYLIVGVGDKFVIAKVPHGWRGSTFTGEIKDVPNDVRDYAVDVLLEKGYTGSEIAQVLRPVLVDASKNYKTGGYVIFLIGLAALAFAIWNLVKCIKRNSDPYSHPVFKKLSVYGNSKDMIEYLENELKQDNVVTIERFTITDNWVIFKSYFSLSVLRISDMIWLYKRITTRRMNFVAVGKDYELVINNNRKGSKAFRVRWEANCDSLLEEIYNRAPWIAIGYLDEYKNLWSRDFKRFVEFIEMRKLQMLNTINRDNI